MSAVRTRPQSELELLRLRVAQLEVERDDALARLEHAEIAATVNAERAILELESKLQRARQYAAALEGFLR